MNDDTHDLLDAYVYDLHAGKQPAKDTVLKKNPELAGTLECLDLLNQMAPVMDDAAHPDDQTTIAGPREETTLHADGAPPANLDFGKYEVVGELGRGGMGVVFKARQRDLNRLVALKMILSSHLASGDSISRFEDEAKAAAGLSHPNIVAIYEAGQIGGQPFFAMQYVSGPSLSQRLRQGRISDEETARIVHDIALAVEHLHKNNIVHRDLKPSNILLDETGHPFVTDFGLVKMLTGDSHRTTTGAIVGTPSYMSPEQATGKTDRIGPASDIWSLGAILYELLTGRPPFGETNPLDTLVQVLEGEPVPPRQLRCDTPEDLETICLRCLEKAPQDRYPSAAALATDLERYLKGEDIDFKRQGAAQRLRRWVRREPALVSRLVVLGLSMALAQISYHVDGTVNAALHVKVMSILAAWAMLSVVCQHFLRQERFSEKVRFLWAAIDVVLFTAVIHVDDALVSPIAIGFPVLIAASGLWFRVRLVWFTTAMVELSYLFLVADHIDRGVVEGLHKHLMCVIALAVLGAIVAYQVNRVRALSRYYENRPLP